MQAVPGLILRLLLKVPTVPHWILCHWLQSIHLPSWPCVSAGAWGPTTRCCGVLLLWLWLTRAGIFGGSWVRKSPRTEGGVSGAQPCPLRVWGVILQCAPLQKKINTRREPGVCVWSLGGMSCGAFTVPTVGIVQCCLPIRPVLQHTVVAQTVRVQGPQEVVCLCSTSVTWALGRGSRCPQPDSAWLDLAWLWAWPGVPQPDWVWPSWLKCPGLTLGVAEPGRTCQCPPA